ncbi:hypothetical protein KIP58_21865 [Xanthomonas campestris pv. campestris]|nr:hypothetical protein [Xanthomonas campestris]MCF8861635.1 hypothetical protein [Xanthomonas campestris pv. campestris]
MKADLILPDGSVLEYKSVNDSLADDRYRLLVIDDMCAVNRFMNGHDVALTESEQTILYRFVADEFDRQMENMLFRAPIRKPYQPVDYHSTKIGKTRAKLLKKRAKDKANRKRPRK